MKKLLLTACCLPIVVLLLNSCNKEDLMEPAQPPVAVDSLAIFRNMSDSCSYTLDGELYTCTSKGSFGKGNGRVNWDSMHTRYSPDSTQYYINYFLYNANTSNLASFNINFIKNFKNSDMYDGALPIVKWPKLADELKMYALGRHPYAIDYMRFNSQDGITISVRDTNRKGWISYVDAPARNATTIPANAQANSVFEVIRLQKLSQNNYEYLLEARFSANVYGANEVPNKVTGYLRLHTQDY